MSAHMSRMPHEQDAMFCRSNEAFRLAASSNNKVQSALQDESKMAGASHRSEGQLQLMLRANSLLRCSGLAVFQQGCKCAPFAGRARTGLVSAVKCHQQAAFECQPGRCLQPSLHCSTKEYLIQSSIGTEALLSAQRP